MTVFLRPQPRDPWATWDPSQATDEQDGRPDRVIVPYVEALRAQGVTCYQSCAGHLHEGGPGGQEGHLWFDAAHAAPGTLRALVTTGRFTTCGIEYAREFEPYGYCSWIPGQMRGALRTLFAKWGLDLPPPGEGE